MTRLDLRKFTQNSFKVPPLINICGLLYCCVKALDLQHTNPLMYELMPCLKQLLQDFEVLMVNFTKQNTTICHRSSGIPKQGRTGFGDLYHAIWDAEADKNLNAVLEMGNHIQLFLIFTIHKNFI